MPDSIFFFVPGLPIATQYRQTKSGVMYKSAKGKQWEKTVSMAAVAAAGAGWKPWAGTVQISVNFNFPIPKSRKELRYGNPHMQDPDATNLFKNTEDGLKRILFLDDNTVQIVGVYKWWCDAGTEGAGISVRFV